MAFVPAVCPDDCVYRATVNGQLPSCNYVFVKGELRGCDPGPGCKRYLSKHGHREPRKGKAPTWDVETGKKMYDAGYTDNEIGKALGVKRETVREYGRRNWGPPNRERQKRE